MTYIFLAFKNFLSQLKKQNFAFLMACGYIIFSYLRPQAIYPVLDFLPWTQLCILMGLGYQIVKGKFKFEFGHFLLFLFACTVLISTNYSSYPENSFRKLDIIFIWFVEVLFFTNCVRGANQTRLILVLFLIVIFKMSLFGAKTWVSRGFGFTSWGIAGPSGFFANSGEFSLLLAMYAVIAIGFISGFKNKNWLYNLAGITAIMTVLGASSRGGQLALVVGLLYLAVIFRKISFKHIIYGSVIVYSVFLIMPQEQLDRFSNMGSDNTSNSRLEYWSAGIDMLNKHKMTGVGFYGFSRYYKDYYKIEQPGQNEFLANRMEVAHNSFIEVGSTLGYPGLILYVWLLLYIYKLNRQIIKNVAKTKKEFKWLVTTAKGMNASLVTYIVGSMFMSVAFYPFLYLILMFSITLSNAAKENQVS